MDPTSPKAPADTPPALPEPQGRMRWLMQCLRDFLVPGSIAVLLWMGGSRSERSGTVPSPTSRADPACRQAPRPPRNPAARLPTAAAGTDFEERLRRLTEDLETLRRQYRELAARPPAPAHAAGPGGEADPDRTGRSPNRPRASNPANGP